MHTTACRFFFLFLREGDSVFPVVAFELVQDFVCPVHDSLRHTGQFGHVYTETVFASSPDELTQENNFVVDLFDRNVVVGDATETFLHFVKLVVMCGEKRFCPCATVFVYVFDDGPRDRDTIVGTGAASQFVEKNETTVR